MRGEVQKHFLVKSPLRPLAYELWPSGKNWKSRPVLCHKFAFNSLCYKVSLCPLYALVKKMCEPLLWVWCNAVCHVCVCVSDRCKVNKEIKLQEWLPLLHTAHFACSQGKNEIRSVMQQPLSICARSRRKCNWLCIWDALNLGPIHSWSLQMSPGLWVCIFLFLI